MKVARILAFIFLLFLGVSSCVGGIPLILDPSGEILKMPLSLLDHSPFHTFLIPGIILLVCNGISSLAIAFPVLRRTNSAGSWVVLQGCVLFGWIAIEAIMIRALVWPQYVYWGIALVLIACGWALRTDAKSAPTHGLRTVNPARR